MKVWSKEDLHKLAETDDVHISPFRKDGVTYALYVRAYNGQNSRWYGDEAESREDHRGRHDRSAVIRSR